MLYFSFVVTFELCFPLFFYYYQKYYAANITTQDIRKSTHHPPSRPSGKRTRRQNHLHSSPPQSKNGTLHSRLTRTILESSALLERILQKWNILWKGSKESEEVQLKEGDGDITPTITSSLIQKDEHGFKDMLWRRSNPQGESI